MPKEAAKSQKWVRKVGPALFALVVGALSPVVLSALPSQTPGDAYRGEGQAVTREVATVSPGG